MRRFLVFLALVMIFVVSGSAEESLAWQRFDVNHDDRLDAEDQQILFESGIWSPTIDINDDGKKDTRDALTLLLLISTWDRNADLVIDEDDFTPLPLLKMPKDDAAAAMTLVNRIPGELIGKVPPDLEARLRKEWKPLGILNASGEGELFEDSGAVALAKHNLDVAQWAYARACQIAPQRDSAFANLALTLAENRRYADALVLLAHACHLNPKVPSTLNNIGWVFARNGQLEEARQYYSEAVALLPGIAQYHLNLGVVLLRMNDMDGARSEFAKAQAAAPTDRQALLMAVASNPAAPADLEACQKEYERQRQEFNNEASPDEQQVSWEELGTEARIEELISQVVSRLNEKKLDAVRKLEDSTKEKLLAAVKPVAPEGKSARADMERWSKNGRTVYDELQRIIQESRQAANELAISFERKEGAEILGSDQQILQLALTAAQEELARTTNAANPRLSFEMTIDHLYSEKMRNAQRQMTQGSATVSLDLTPADRDTIFLATAGFVPVMGMILQNESYGKDFEKGAYIYEEIVVNTAGIDEPTFGITNGAVSLEWNTGNDEIKLQVGQGIIVAGTWSPKNGFGFQSGVGIEFPVGPLKVTAGNYIKFGSDGSISIDYEGGATIGGEKISMGLGNGISIPVRAACHEPIGTLSE